MTTAITVSERAARRIGEILKAEGDGAMLRISVEGGGAVVMAWSPAVISISFGLRRQVKCAGGAESNL